MRASENVHRVSISSSSRLSSSSLSQTARRRSNPIQPPLSFCRIRIRRAGSFASSVCAPSARLHVRIRARSADACVSILHFRAVNDGVDTSRRNLDLDASSFLSFLSFPTLIQLVPTQTRRARLPVCARNPLGGQVLFIARTLSRPIVVVVVSSHAGGGFRGPACGRRTPRASTTNDAMERTNERWRANVEAENGSARRRSRATNDASEEDETRDVETIANECTPGYTPCNASHNSWLFAHGYIRES